MRRPTLNRARNLVGLLERLAQEALVEDVSLSPAAAKVRLNAELNYYRNLDASTVTVHGLFHRLCISLANRRGMFSVIFGVGADINCRLLAYERILLRLDPRSVLRRFEGRESDLVAALIRARKLTTAQSKRQKGNARSYFPLYAKGLVGAARFLSQFSSDSDLRGFFKKWRHDPNLLVNLPAYLADQGIPGLGETLAADALKEVGFHELGKPDQWVKRIMSTVGWVAASPSPSDIQRVLREMSRQLGPRYPPVIVDKLMYLVGSGKFVMVEPTLICRSHFEELSKLVGE